MTEVRLSKVIYHDTLSVIFFIGYITDNGCDSKETPLKSTGVIVHDQIVTSPTISPDILYKSSQLKDSNTHEKYSSEPLIKTSHVNASQVIISHDNISSVSISHVTISSVITSCVWSGIICGSFCITIHTSSAGSTRSSALLKVVILYT